MSVAFVRCESTLVGRDALSATECKVHVPVRCRVCGFVRRCLSSEPVNKLYTQTHTRATGERYLCDLYDVTRQTDGGEATFRNYTTCRPHIMAVISLQCTLS